MLNIDQDVWTEASRLPGCLSIAIRTFLMPCVEDPATLPFSCPALFI